MISDFAMSSSAAASSASSGASGTADSNRLEGSRIVEPETILDDEQLKMEEKSKKNIAEDVHDKESVLQFLARRRVIENEVKCKRCQRQVNITIKTASSDGYVWTCVGCGQEWTMRTGTSIPGQKASLQDILERFCQIFDLKGGEKPENKIAYAASIDIISTTFEIIKTSVKLGRENVVHFDVIRLPASNQSICVGVENNSNLTMVDTDLSTFLDKWSEPGCKIVHSNMSFEASVLNPDVMKCSTCQYINVDDQTQSDSAKYMDQHLIAISNCVKDLQASHGRLKDLLKRPITYLDSAKVMSAQRYLAHSHIENPLAWFLRFMQEQKEKK